MLIMGVTSKMSGSVVDAVDVSDVCGDIDEVVLFDDGDPRMRACAFIDEGDGTMDEQLIDIRDYPAVVTICRRAFDVTKDIRFKPLPTVEVDR